VFQRADEQSPRNGQSVSPAVHVTMERRFLAMAFIESYGTLDRLGKAAAASHTVRELSAFDGVKVLDFVPRTQAGM
jgi:hypothetical protein